MCIRKWHGKVCPVGHENPDLSPAYEVEPCEDALLRPKKEGQLVLCEKFEDKMGDSADNCAECIDKERSRASRTLES